jgi:hypothetical protein
MDTIGTAATPAAVDLQHAYEDAGRATLDAWHEWAGTVEADPFDAAAAQEARDLYQRRDGYERGLAFALAAVTGGEAHRWAR